MLEEQGRQAARIPFDTDVEEYFSKNETYGLKALNLSEYGLGLIADRTFRRHDATYAWLEFFLPTGHRIRALGERMYEQGHNDDEVRYGYRFKYIAPRERQELKNFLFVRAAELEVLNATIH